MHVGAQELDRSVLFLAVKSQPIGFGRAAHWCALLAGLGRALSSSKAAQHVPAAVGLQLVVSPPAECLQLVQLSACLQHVLLHVLQLRFNLLALSFSLHLTQGCKESGSVRVAVRGPGLVNTSS